MRKKEVYLKTTYDGFETGALVKSVKGRDSGKYFMVLERINDGNVLLLGEKDESFLRPKRKNVKHLLIIGKKFAIIDSKNFCKYKKEIQEFILQNQN